MRRAHLPRCLPRNMAIRLKVVPNLSRRRAGDPPLDVRSADLAVTARGYAMECACTGIQLTLNFEDRFCKSKTQPSLISIL